ncbi:MAG: tetratricopeptide repeat protein [Marinifilaceae bacterium]
MQILSICTTILVLLLQNFCFATNTSDSLKNILNKASEEKQAEILNKISDHYYNINADSALLFAKKALVTAKKQNNEKEVLNAYLKIGIINQIQGKINESNQFLKRAHTIALKTGSPKDLLLSHFYFGAYHYYKGQLDSSLLNFNKSLLYCEKVNNSKFKLRNINNIGNIYWARGNSEQALKYYLQSYHLADSLKDQKVLTFTLFNLGNIYLNQNRQDLAIKYYNQVKELAKKQGNTTIQANVLNNMGIMSRNQGNYPKAIEYAKKANRLYRKIKDNTGISITYSNLGNAYYKTGQQDSAIYFINKASVINRNSNNNKELAVDLEFLARIYLNNNMKEKAFPLIQEGLQLSKTMGLDSQTRFLSQLSNYYYQKKQFKKAYDYKIKQYHLEDSLYNSEQIDKIAEMQTRFESEQKEKENELLRMKNNLMTVQLNQQKKIRNYSIAFAIVALLLTLIIFRLMRVKVQKNKEINKFNKELETINQKLKISNASKDRFFSIIAHDLRSPFHAILGFSDLLNEELKGKANTSVLQEYNSALNESSHKLFNLLENLLEWANSQRGNLDFQPEKFDLYEKIQQNLEIFKLKAQEKGIRLNSFVKPGTKVIADQNMINTILRNLISNAIKFTAFNGEVNILTKSTNGILEIAVQDTGIGISPEIQAKLFQIDHNISTSGTNEEEGSGLGLIICKEFIEKHGGKIWVQSQPNIGSTFSFSLSKGNRVHQSAS